jgi:hypothetical protein
MPKQNKYTSKDFEKDLKELENMINGAKVGGAEDDMMEAEPIMDGGASGKRMRHFVLSELNGRSVKFGTAEIGEKKSPSAAARKILKSIAHEKNLYGNDKLKLGKVTFSIRETTQWRKIKKIYGPYVGEYKKYTAEEMKKAKAFEREYHMKPVVTLKKSNNMKGGSKK